MCLPPGTKPDTSIVPSTCGPVRVTVAGRKMLSFGASSFGASALGASAAGAEAETVFSGASGCAGAAAGVAGAAAFGSSRAGAGAACAGAAGAAGALFSGCAGAGASAFGAGASVFADAGWGAGAGAGLGLGERSILPRIFICGISSFTLITLLLMTTSFSSSRSCFLASSSVMVVCFREMRSRIELRALAAARFDPNSFSRTA